MAHPDFGRSVDPISTRGIDYAHLITTGTPAFSDLPTALTINIKVRVAKSLRDEVFDHRAMLIHALNNYIFDIIKNKRKRV